MSIIIKFPAICTIPILISPMNGQISLLDLHANDYLLRASADMHPLGFYTVLGQGSEMLLVLSIHCLRRRSGIFSSSTWEAQRFLL